MTTLLSEPGAAAQMAATQMEGLGNILENIKNKFEVLAITIGKAGFTNIFKSMALGFSDFLTQMEKFAQTAGGALTIQLIGLAGAFTVVGTAINILAPLLGKLGVAFETLKVASLSFITTPLGIAVLAIAAAVTTGMYAWDKYKISMDNAIKKQQEVVDSLGSTKTNFDIYNKAVETYGINSKEAGDAALELRKSILEVGKNSKNSEYFVREFGGSIDKTTGKIKYQKQFVEDLSKVLEEKLIQSYTNLSDKSLSLYNNKNGFANWLLDVERSYEALVVATKNGNSQAKAALADLDNAAKVIGNSWLDTTDAATVSSEEIKKFASEIVKLNGYAPEMEGAIVNHLLNVASAAKEAGKAQSTMGTQVAKVFADIRKENANVKLSDEESLKHKIDILDKGIIKVKEAYTEEIKQVEIARLAKLMQAGGSAEEIEKVEAEHQKNIIQLKNQEVSAELALIAEKQRSFLAVYKTQLSYVEDYYKYQFAILDTNNKTEEQANKDSLNRKLIDIEAHYKDAEQIKRFSTDVTIQSYKDELRLADDYYTQKANLVKKEYDARVLLAPVLKDTEKKTNAELKLLSEELVKKQTDNLNERKTKYVEVINAMRSLEKGLTDKIRDEINARRDHTASTEETIRNLKYKTMTDAQVQEAKLTEAMRLASEARKAMQAGEFELAKKKADEAKTAFADVAGGIDKQSMSASAYAKAIGNISGEIKSVNDTWDTASRGIVKTTQEQVDGAKNIAGNAVYEVDKLDKAIIKTNTNFDALGVKKVEVTVTDALEKLRAINANLETIKDKQIQITADKSALDQIVTDANGKLNEVQDKKVDLTVDAGLTMSPRQPLGQGLIELKEKLDTALTIDDSMTDITLKFRADGEGSPQALSTVFDSITNALSEIKRLLDEISKLPVELIVVIKDNAALMESIAGIGEALAALDKEWIATLHLDVFGLSELQSAWATWKNFIDSPPDIYREVVINEIHRVTEEKALGGKAGSSRNHANGDRLPGYGGGDIVDARLEPGEWVIRKEAVRKYGDDFMAMVNGMSFATGGSVAERIKQMTSAKKKRKTVSSLPARNKEVEKVEEIKEEVKTVERDYGKELRDVAEAKAEKKAKEEEEAKAAAEERKRVEAEKKRLAVEKAAEEGYLSQLTPSERAEHELSEAAKVDPDSAFKKASDDQRKIRLENEQRLVDEENALKESRLREEVEAAELKGYLDALSPEDKEEYYYNEKAKVDSKTAYDKSRKSQEAINLEDRRKAEEDRLQSIEDKKKEAEDLLKQKVEDAELEGYLSSLSKSELAEYYYNEKAKVDPKTAYDKARKDQLSKAEETIGTSSSDTSSLTEEEKANRPKNWKYFASGGYVSQDDDINWKKILTNLVIQSKKRENMQGYKRKKL